MRSSSHLARCTRLRVGLASIVCGLLLTGCQSFPGASTARLRVVDLSADSGAIDVYQSGHAVAYNLAYGAVTSYTAVDPGGFSATVSPAGSRVALSTARAALVPGGRYTLLVNGPLAGLQQTLLMDQPPAGGPSLRILHQAERVGPVDVYLVPAGQRLAGTLPVAMNLVPGAATGYRSVPVGSCAAVVVPAGSRPLSGALALHTGRRAEFGQSSARTLILLDAPPTLTRRLDVIETVDDEPVD